MIPQYANGEARSTDASRIGILRHFSVISELKVGASTTNGLQRRSILADVVKLGRLLDEHGVQSPEAELPLAYVCVLDNHHRKTFEIETLEAEVCSGVYHPGIRLITASASVRPVAPVGGALVWCGV